MKTADKIILDALAPHMSDLGYAMVVDKIEKAGGITNLTDTVAIAELVLAKKKFGSRSAAGEYAANIRWKEFHTAGPSGEKYRTETINGVPTQFEVKVTTIGSIKNGDIITTGSNKVPTQVVSIENKDGKTVLNTKKLDGLDRFQTFEEPNREARLWTPTTGGKPSGESSSTGSLNPSRKVDTNKLSRQDLEFINTGGSGPERVRRRNEVIDRYAGQGIDVSKPVKSSGRGGAQWLGTMNQ